MAPAKTMMWPLIARPTATFETVWNGERPRIWRLTARLSSSMDAADDLTQEVGVRALAAYSNFRRDSEVSTWLYRIAVNVVLRWREQQREKEFAGEEQLFVLPSNLPSPENTALQSERFQQIYAALDKLPEELRTPLLLHIWEGLKYREISAILEIPVGTVMSRLHSARQRLRTELKDWENESI